MHGWELKLLHVVNGNTENGRYRFDFVLKLIAKIGTHIKENIFNVPELFSFELSDLLPA